MPEVRELAGRSLIRASARAAVGIVALALPLSACNSVDSLKNDLIDQSTYQSFPGRFIDVANQRKVEAAKDNGVTRLGETLAQNKNTKSGRSFGAQISTTAGVEELAESESLQRYIATILRRLLAGNPEKTELPRVIISTDPTYNAEMKPGNVMVVNQGLLVNATSEDEVAFLLAHELSHSLLNHLDSDRHHAAQAQVEKTAASLLMAATSPKASSVRKAPAAVDGSQALAKQIAGATDTRGKAALAFVGYQALQDKILKPAWVRQQEDEADLLGFDLAQLAKYDHSAYQTVMQRFASDKKMRRQGEAEAEQRFDEQVGDLLASGRIKEGTDAVITKLSGMPWRLLDAMVGEVGRAHHSPEQREKDLDGYVNRDEKLLEPSGAEIKVDTLKKAVFEGPGLRALARSVYAQRAEELIAADNLDAAEKLLKDVVKGAFEKDPQLRLVYYKLHTAQGRKDLAIKDLEIALTGKEVPRDCFTLLLIEYFNSGQPAKSLGVLDKMEGRFGGSEENLGVRVRLLLAAGRMTEAGAVYDRCKKMTGHSAVDDCDVAWSEGGEKPMAMPVSSKPVSSKAGSPHR